MHAPIKTHIYIKAELTNILEIEKIGRTMSTGIKFNSFDDRYVTTTDQPTIIAVQSTSTSKKLCIIISGLVVIGIIATVGVILGVVILKKGL